MITLKNMHAHTGILLSDYNGYIGVVVFTEGAEMNIFNAICEHFETNDVEIPDTVWDPHYRTDVDLRIKFANQQGGYTSEDITLQAIAVY